MANSVRFSFPVGLQGAVQQPRKGQILISGYLCVCLHARDCTGLIETITLLLLFSNSFALFEKFHFFIYFRKNYLLLPPHWLCYQAPEIVRQLTAHDPGSEIQYYTKETDVYAFGYVNLTDVFCCCCILIYIYFCVYRLVETSTYLTDYTFFL